MRISIFKPVIEGKNRYCGPAAIAVILGIKTHEASRLIRCYGGRSRQRVRRCSVAEVMAVLRKAGCSVKDFHSFHHMPTCKRPTLRQWFSAFRGFRESGKYYLVNVTGHFVVVKGVMAIDNLSKDWMSVSSFPGNRKRVKGVVEVTLPSK